MTARGIRNNNPGNIENNGTAWLGLCEEQNDPRFCQFSKMEYGCRALLKTLLTYRRKHGLVTIRGIINRWAPSVENNTSGYMSRVSKDTGYGLDEKIPETRSAYIAIAKAIAAVECSKDSELIGEIAWLRAADMCGFE